MHAGEDDEPDAQDCKVTYKCKEVAQVVELVLGQIMFTLLFLEQVSEGTRLMWLICSAAQPILNSPGKIV